MNTAAEPLFEIRALAKSYPVRSGPLGHSRQRLQALADIDLDLYRGECLALVGESGSGKSTLAKVMLRLVEADRGTLRFDGEDLMSLSAGALRERRRDFQLVFQDATAALDPRLAIGASVAEPLRTFSLGTRAGRRRRVAELLAMTGLSPALAARFPHQLSGGQRQRATLARALASEPRLLVLDEPVSALDVSVQARILETLRDLQRRLGLTMVFITHDLSVVEQIADRVGVLYLGRLVEVGAARELLAQPRHPYTASLLASVPVADPERRRQGGFTLAGEVPSPLRPPPGCPFHPRCPVAEGLCRRRRPELEPVPPGPGLGAAENLPLEPGTTAEDNVAGVGAAADLASPAAWRVACHFPGALGVGEAPAERGPDRTEPSGTLRPGNA